MLEKFLTTLTSVCEYNIMIYRYLDVDRKSISAIIEIKIFSESRKNFLNSITMLYLI